MQVAARPVAQTLASALPGVYRALRGPLLRRGAIRGLPPGLSLETLDGACEQQTGERVREVAHSPLTSLKREPGTGSFRVWVRTSSKARWSAIYKREPPAAGEREAGRGRGQFGEVAVYTHVGDELAAFLPGVYWFEPPADERDGYRFLIEDLWATHRRVRDRSDLERVTARLGEVHQVLTRTFSSSGIPLPRRDRGFPRRIEANAEDSLARLVAIDPILEGVSRLAAGWAGLVRTLGQDEFQDHEAASVIHGDLVPQHALVPIARRDWARLGMRLIDWEGVSWGMPEFDLAVLLAETEAAQRGRLLETYARSTRRSVTEVQRRYLWCSLARSLGEVRTFEQLSRRGDKDRTNTLRAADRSANRALAAADELERTGTHPLGTA